MTDLERLDALAATFSEDEIAPLTVYELAAIRNRDQDAKTPARTWAVEDRRRLIVTLDVAVRERDELREALERRSRAYHLSAHSSRASIEWVECELSECFWDRAALHREDGT